MTEQPHEVVYVIGTPGSFTVKIGRTTDVTRRLAAIQRMSPVPLIVLWTHPGGHELETALHRHFKSIRSHGEWFKFTDPPVELIRTAVTDRPWARTTKRSPKRVVIDLKPRQLQLPDPTSFAGFDAAFTKELAELRAISDPVERFNAVRARRTQVAEADRRIREHQRNAVRSLHDEGRSWRVVGELLGISGSRAEAFVKGRTSR
ncbi:GIY-YIG nuclease family protein [Streptomyces sp. NBC_00356]|uniref:GIY-YIG nuclease family protein n=1 Tax=Streptomyces sp. NBC_00356 TaxID=2975724 RepID=UPI002E2533F6